MRSRLLLREFVEHALYARSGGYFTRQVVGGLREPLRFEQMADEAEYRDRVAAAAQLGDREMAWLTPSETFTPFYGAAVARSVVARHCHFYGHAEPLRVIEVGGGNGTFAADFLGQLRDERADLYARCKYVLVEVSERLAEAQRANLSAAGHDAGRVEVHHQCARRWAEQQYAAAGALAGPWHILAMEVLDNLPHDKLRLRELGSGEVEGGCVVAHRIAVRPPALNAKPGVASRAGLAGGLLSSSRFSSFRSQW